MKGAFQLVRVAGIPVRIHWSFGLLILWVVYTAISYDLGWQATLMSIAIVLTIFLCVVLHEYGHALTARQFGVDTKDIILSPIGGIARLDFIPENPREEILIAIAGPAVNLVIATVLLGIAIFFTPYWVDLGSRQFWGLDYAQPIVIIIAKINLILLAFNMVPAFPMDGGRVFRALLSIPFGRVRATMYAGLLGQAIGLFLFGAGAFEMIFGKPVYIGGVKVSDFILMIIGLFIYFAAKREIKAVRTKHMLETTTVRQIADQNFTTVSANIHVHDFDSDIAGDDGILLEIEGRVVGILFNELLTQARSDNHPGARLGDYISDFYQNIDASLTISKVVDIFGQKGYRICPVYDHNVLVGVLNRTTLLAFIAGNNLPAPEVVKRERIS
jgi:Zn-dependent protease